MSSLDQYSYCPCGNGKKIKFCKCNQHFAEMEKIHRMIVGEQNVAALDKINADLKTLPSEPWLLAMKCELLLQLRELDSLEETSAKFIRLQPDNPLAKLYRSLLAVIRGNTEEGASLLLQAIGDSTEVLPPMTATVALNLLESMAQRGMTLPALLHAEMLTDMGDQIAQYGFQAISSLSSQPNTNILSRESLPSTGDSEGTPYSERLTEAQALVGSYRITTAKTKLESMIREFGPEAPLLQLLLYCQLMLSDVESGGATCKKLVAAASLSEPQRVYYQALAYELAPQVSGVAVKEELCQYVIEDPEFEDKLLANTNLAPLSVDQFRGLLSALLQEEVPPKHCFVIISPALREQFPELEATQPGSWIAYYGKQTDKPARLIILESQNAKRRAQTDQLKKDLGIDGNARELIETLPTTYLSQTSASILVKQNVPEDRTAAFKDARKQLVIDTFLDFPLEALGGETPRQAAANSDKKIPLMGLLLHLQGSGTSDLDSTAFRELHKSLNLTQPKIDASEDVFDLVGGAAYFWTDLSNIDPASLIQLMQSSITRGVASIAEELVEKSTRTEWSEELKKSAEYTEANLRTQIVSDPHEAEKLFLRIAELGKELGVSVGQAVLQRVELLHMLGRTAEGQHYLEQSFRENPDDPALLQFLQMMMRQQQGQAMGGAPRGAGSIGAGAAPSDAGGSGLWTPDQPASSEPAGGGSKLWIPGQ